MPKQPRPVLVPHGWPVATTPERAAELFGVPVRDVRRACKELQPYRHQDGTPRWSVKEIARVLAMTGRIVPPDPRPVSGFRTGNVDVMGARGWQREAAEHFRRLDA